MPRSRFLARLAPSGESSQSRTVQTAFFARGADVHLLAGMVAVISLALGRCALATEGPVREPSPVPMQQELIPHLPEFPVELPETTGPLRLFDAAPFGPDDKGGTYTDMGVGQAGHLTQREEALLALGRAAVEASRAAGTLEMHRDPTLAPTAGAKPDEVARQKRESLRHPPASAPVLGTGSPFDFMTAGRVAQSMPGDPFEMTLSELEKLAAAQNGAGDRAVAPAAIHGTADAPKAKGEGIQK